MGEGKTHFFRDPISTITGPYTPMVVRKNKWITMDDKNDDICDSISSVTSSSFEDSIGSISSSSSLDLVEDDASSSNTSSSSSLNGPLYELSDLMAHLPIKRGLSKHYEGKSQSFTSLSNVSCIEDLAKRAGSHFTKKMMKPCRSYGGRLHIQKTISKKSPSRDPFSSSFVGSPRPPIPHAKKSF